MSSADGRVKRRAGGGGPVFGPRDLLVPYLLLAIQARQAHGYLIEQYLRGLGLAKVQLSTLYRTLRQLEEQGLVTSAWEAGPGGPARRTYALTNAGEAWLRAGATALETYRSAIDAFFGAYASPKKRAAKKGRAS
jgi:PadR family transcriptional regulator PadR